jgi:hypothetical protein
MEGVESIAKFLYHSMLFEMLTHNNSNICCNISKIITANLVKLQ